MISLNGLDKKINYVKQCKQITRTRTRNKDKYTHTIYLSNFIKIVYSKRRSNYVVHYTLKIIIRDNK